MSAPYSISDEAATTISQIACYNGHIPQGAPSSPVITNMICRPLDNQLMRLAKNSKISYTRYVDDITFSSYNSEFPKGVISGTPSDLKVGKALRDILEKNSFKINEEKVFLNSRNTRQEVTGLTVNQFPNIKREYIKNIRALLHGCKKNGVNNAAILYIKKGYCKNPAIVALSNQPNKEEAISTWFKNVLKGKITFIKQIKGADSFTFLNFALQLNEIFGEAVFDLAILDDFNTRVNNNVFVLKYDDIDEYIQGSAFILPGYGLLTNFHVTESENFFKVYRCSEFDINHIGLISKDVNEKKTNKDIDYALYEFKDSDEGFQIGDSKKLKRGDQVITIGYPNFQKGDSPFVQNCEITSITKYIGGLFYTVGGRIVHGASGGLVLNEKKQIIGLLKGGIVSLMDEATCDKQGFVPIHIILEDIEQ